PDQSKILWYINGIYKSQYDNLPVINSTETLPGQIWSFRIIPFDGENTSLPLTSISMTIEDVPDILAYGFYPINDTEGHYYFWFDVKANPVHPIGGSTASVSLNIIVNESESFIKIAEWNGTYYVLDWKYNNYSMLGSEIYIIAEVQTQVIYFSTTSLISNYVNFDFQFIDTSPPRVKNVVYNFDDESHPTQITFYVEVEDFGSSISNVTMFYSFSTSTGNTIRSKVFGVGQTNETFIGFSSIEMNKLNNSYYMVTIPFNSDSSKTLEYSFQLYDQFGNLNTNGWPEGLSDKSIKYVLPNPGFSQEELAMYGIVIFIIVLIFSFILNRKFRSKELVGLDKELVIKNIKKLKIKDEEFKDYINQYTLGIILSYFDQRKGPIPVLVNPDILRDDFNKLIELSDVSFSTGRFVKNFEDEELSSFTFHIDKYLEVKVLSYAFSLNRPQARGGAENLSLDILLFKESFPLMSQFTNHIRVHVNKMHKILDSDTEGKENVNVKNVMEEIRILVAKIALSHIKIYGSLEFESSEFLEGYDGEIT
ncbi:MAG: hypothetical protein ACFFD1_14905, partial [Candidatus Thorarchaeota archaeon]